MPAGPDYTELGKEPMMITPLGFLVTEQERYHLISEGPNELTAKLSCDTGPFNSTKGPFSECYRSFLGAIKGIIK